MVFAGPNQAFSIGETGGGGVGEELEEGEQGSAKAGGISI